MKKHHTGIRQSVCVSERDEGRKREKESGEKDYEDR